MKRVAYLFLMIAALSMSVWGGVRIVDISPHSPASRCSKAITVTGEIKLKRLQPVTYQFVYSDGITSRVRTIPLMGKKVRVKSKRRVYGSFDGWVKLVVRTPKRKIVSDAVPLKVKCPYSRPPIAAPIPPTQHRSKIKSVTITPPPAQRVRCPATIPLEGTIQTRGKVKVRYRFRSKDGHKSPIQTAFFRHRGVYRVSYDWPVRNRTKTKVRLEVLSPVKKHSAYVPLDIKCRRRAITPDPSAEPVGRRPIRDLQVKPVRLAVDYCPINVPLEGRFWHKEGIKVRYRFVRSDGVTTPWETKKFRSSGYFTAHYTFRVGESIRSRYRLEVQVRPLHRSLRRAWHSYASPWRRMDVRCIEPAGDPVSTLRLRATSPAIHCPEEYTFRGEIVLSRPATIRYRFRRSDGHESPIFTLHARQGGSYPVQYRWRLPRNLREGWVQLLIVEPFARRSYKARFSRRGCGRRHVVEPVEVTPAPSQGHGRRSEILPALIFPIVAGIIANAAQGSSSEPAATVPAPAASIPAVSAQPHPVSPAPEHTMAPPLPLPAPAAARDADRDGIEDRLEDRLLSFFRPYYLFARGEKYLPSDPLYQVRHARVLMANPLAAAQSAFDSPIVVENCRGLSNDPGRILSCTQPPADLRRTRGAMTVALDLDDSLRSDPGNGRKKDWQYLAANPAGLYGHVVPTEDGRYKIEYWQFFPYSGTAEKGVEGDWKVLELWYNPSTQLLEKICYPIGNKKSCIDLTQSRPVAIGSNLYEYRGPNYSAAPAPISATEGSLLPAAYQNNAARFYRSEDGSMHPMIYLQRGTHDFWPTPVGSIEGQRSAHQGNGPAYLTDWGDLSINLGELNHPNPDASDPQGIVLRYAGTWGRNSFETMRRAYGPPLHCEWQLAPDEKDEWASRIRTGCSR